MMKRFLGSGRWALVFVAVAILFSGCQSPVNPKKNSGSSGGGKVPAGSLTANLTGAKSLVTTSTAASASFHGARSGDLPSPLMKILEDGTPASVFTVPEGVTLPRIAFMAVHPVDNTVYISFESSFSLGEDVRVSFIRLVPPVDGTTENSTIEIVESSATVKRFQTEGWKTKQPPVAFADDGSLYYAVDTDQGTTLKRYFLGVSTAVVPDVKMNIERFFSDGTNVYFLGKNNTEIIKSTFLRVFRPGAAQPETVFETDTDGSMGAWIKDVYLHNGAIVLSGYNIGDPDIATRRYDGILRLKYDAVKAKWDWLHVYGAARDTANKSYVVNRRQLKASYFKGADELVSQDKIKAFAAPFFVGGIAPDGLDWFRVVDIDKVNLDATRVPTGVTVKLEHKFWFGLLSEYAGFDDSYFYEVFLTKGSPDSNYYGTGVTQPIPAIVYPSGADGVALPSYVFDSLFGTDVVTQRRYDGTAAAYETAVAAATTSYFSSIKLKSSATAPLSVDFSDGDDLAWFKTWLDTYFTYTLAKNVVMTSTKMYSTVLLNGTYPLTTIGKVFFAIKAVYGDSKTGLLFKARYLTDGAPDRAKIEALVTKFYPSAVANASALTSGLMATPSGWANSNAGKKTILETAFVLGEPRVSSTDSLKYPHVFYDYGTNQGLVDNPYLNLNLGTLFDSFNNLERFALDTQGSAFGLFRKGNGAGFKMVKLYDGPTGDIGSSVTLDDLPSLGAEFYGDYLYFVKKEGTASYGISRIPAFSSAPVEEVLMSPDLGLVVYDYRVRHVGTQDFVYFTAAESATGKTKMGVLDVTAGTVSLQDLTGLDESDQLEIYG